MSSENRTMIFAAFFVTAVGLLALWGSSRLTTSRTISKRSVASAQTTIKQPTASDRARLVASYGKLPLSLEVNEGQVRGQGHSAVRFFSRGDGYALFLTGNEAVLSLHGTEAKPTEAHFRARVPNRSGRAESRWSLLRRPEATVPRVATELADGRHRAEPAVLSMQLVGANPEATVRGLDELPGKSNYFIGNDPKKWRTNVANYAKVKYEGVYPGIDLVYYGNQRQLEYDFVVAPGADPAAIRLAFNREFHNAESLEIDGDGNLRVRVKNSEVTFKKPVLYQPASTLVASNGQDAKAVDGRFHLTDDHSVSVEVASYDRSKPLVIDPVLSYSSFLGGTGDEAIASVSVAVDSIGNAYVASGTLSTDFPVTSGSFQTGYGGSPAICDQGDSFCGDAFVTKINPAGTAIIYSTYLGGTSSDYAFGLAVDGAGNAYVTGTTESTNFPVTAGVFQPTFGGYPVPCDAYIPCGDTFVTKLSPSGSSLVYSSYLGGSDSDYAEAIFADSAGNAYVTGSTASSNFPTTPGAFQTTFTGNYTCIGRSGATIPCPAAYVTKVNPSGTALVYSTYLGGYTGGGDGGDGVVADALGRVTVDGSTCSTDFPITSTAFQSRNAGICDVFLTVLNPAGSRLSYSTYLGGNGWESAYSLAVDAFGNAYLAGQTFSTNFPVTAGAVQTHYGGNSDAFVAKINPTLSGAASLVYCTYLGGSSGDLAGGITVDGQGDAYVVGEASLGFPIADSLQAAVNGRSDVFVAELNPQGTSLTYSTYLGGSGDDLADFAALGQNGNLYVAGWTRSADFPTTPRVLQPSFGGGNRDLFVVKISPASSPGVSFVPATLTFANQAAGTTSPPQTVLLHNVGSASLSISDIRTIGDFGQTNNCGATLAGGGSCAISITFTPSGSGRRSGTLSVSDNAANSPQQMALTGSGTP